MDEKVYAYMDKVRQYFKEKGAVGGVMDTGEVLNRILSYSGATGTDRVKAVGEEEIRLYLDNLLEKRHEANQIWNIGASRPITSHRRFIGPVIVFVKKVLRKITRIIISPIIAQQNEYNALLTDMLNEVCNKLILTERIFNVFAQNVGNQLEEFDVDNEIRSEEIKKKIAEISQRLSDMKKLYESDISYIAWQHRQMAREERAPEKPAVTGAARGADIPPKEAKIDYFLFENRFRGPEADVKESLRQYLRFFKQDDILDIGCGRGEFLELLAENKLKAKGIDIYDDFVTYCRDKGLDVDRADAAAYLEGLEDNSLGGIFLGQVIEHLDQDYLTYLLKLAYRKLKPGAYLVAETPNPTMVSTFTNSFYLDPSHVKPVHPETMRFILSYFGYVDVEILYNEKTKIPYNLPLLKGDNSIKNLAGFNDGIGLLNSLLFGYQDYAAVGRKQDEGYKL